MFPNEKEIVYVPPPEDVCMNLCMYVYGYINRYRKLGDLGDFGGIF